ncbi:MAG: hypothetical protein HWQ35_27550 [Nostoc sp. NMS1]|uniref:carbohydrate-binding module family 14 protein n=1 Tax=unclassified Nostoc TaxID=2593658 RepID=UPI0025CC10A9|nr:MULTISPECIES: carbohydrate-binding module family 14 protein [unclassified Nostoc]MBN3910163.1 hypothetical protein [Nostoc sp. NMS1]MBN3990959.1 hypothetical protein [Nostoc sp. NMS2]
MTKLIKQIICSFIAIVAVIGLTTGSANAQSLLNLSIVSSVIQDTSSNRIPNFPCTSSDFDKLYPNPEDPNSFYQCAPYGLVLMPCPTGLIFDVEADRCEYPTERVTKSGTEANRTNKSANP